VGRISIIVVPYRDTECITPNCFNRGEGGPVS
jgi:hypothetical protein